MSENKKGLSRRNFFKTAGAAGIGSILAPYSFAAGKANDKTMLAQSPMPTRPFGKTGVNVSILGMGGMFDIPNNQIILKQALRMGVTYWDTANSYGYGRSEKGMGKFFTANPGAREKVFLVTKAGDSRPRGMTDMLNTSLERMQTSYIDLFFVHGIRDFDELDQDTKAWSQKAKEEGKIRFFGFSTHSNMESCLMDASKVDWIDGIMFTYNYRLMAERSMKDAVQACHDAGIGLTAMKTQGGGSVRTDSPTELELAGRFVEKGFTSEQAKLKAIWEDSRIASICSQMPSIAILMANASAATDNKSLSRSDRELLHHFASETASSYCAGCAKNCEPAITAAVPVCDILRYLMYSRNYGDRALASELFSGIDPEIRRKLPEIDFSRAEKRCPRNIAIGKLMKEASMELA